MSDVLINGVPQTGLRPLLNIRFSKSGRALGRLRQIPSGLLSHLLNMKIELEADKSISLLVLIASITQLHAKAGHGLLDQGGRANRASSRAAGRRRGLDYLDVPALGARARIDFVGSKSG
jgi:hypothetical protein